MLLHDIVGLVTIVQSDGLASSIARMVLTTVFGLSWIFTLQALRNHVVLKISSAKEPSAVTGMESKRHGSTKLNGEAEYVNRHER